MDSDVTFSNRIQSALQKIQKNVIGAIDKYVGIEKNVEDRWLVRAAFMILIAEPVVIVAFVIGSFANNAKQDQKNEKQEQRIEKQEQVTPAPKKKEGQKLQGEEQKQPGKDASYYKMYKMAFAPRKEPNAAAAAQKPIPRMKQMRH